MWNEQELERLEEEEHDEMLTELSLIISLLHDYSDDIEYEISRFYSKYGKDGVVTYAEARKYVSEKNHNRRYLVLFLTISDLLYDFVETIKENFGNTFESIRQKECNFFDAETPYETFAWGEDELTWVDRLTNDKEKWLTKIQQDLKQEFVRGRSLDNVIDQLHKRITTMENVLERLLGTEATAASSSFRKRIFKELGVKKYRFYTQRDERVCDVCGPMNGMVFPITQYEVGVTAAPIHPNCRCFTIPID